MLSIHHVASIQDGSSPGLLFAVVSGVGCLVHGDCQGVRSLSGACKPGICEARLQPEQATLPYRGRALSDLRWPLLRYQSISTHHLPTVLERSDLLASFVLLL